MGLCGSKNTPLPQEEAKQSNKPEPKIEDLYRQGAELGRGHFARVVTCTRIADGKQFAMKIIKKNEMKSPDVVHKEVTILKTVGNHPNIVELIDVQEDRKHCYLIMEMCPGGDLFSKIVEEGNYSEKQARKACKQLAEALIWIHKKGVTHRDLKPENILLASDSLESDIKVADFGLSKLMKENQEIMKTVCGTWAYCAPEVLEKIPYTQEVDCWTLGVLMFILLSGYHPFDVFGDLNEPELMDKIKDCSYDFDDPVWEDVSQEAKDLITALLHTDPKKRMTLQKYLASRWITGQDIATHNNQRVADNLKKFNQSKFRAIVYAHIATQKMKTTGVIQEEITEGKSKIG